MTLLLASYLLYLSGTATSHLVGGGGYQLYVVSNKSPIILVPAMWL